jgi:hypothetical protein
MTLTVAVPPHSHTHNFNADESMGLAEATLWPLTIEARPLFEEAFAALQVPISDYSFANNIVWQRRQRLLYAVIEGCLCLFSIRDGELLMPLPPLGPVTQAIAATSACVAMMRRFNEGRAGWQIYCVHEELAEALAASPDPQMAGWTITAAPSDFVYRTGDLIELGGVAYKSKRNDINQLLRAHPDARLEALRPEHLDAVVEMSALWLAQRASCEGALHEGALDSLALEEFDAIAEAVTNMDALGLTGLRLIIEGRTEAFLIGEKLLPEVGHVLFEKANRAIRGAAQLIFREYCRSFAECALTNTGDSLGCASLARSKESYRPLYLGKKFTISSG